MTKTPDYTVCYYSSKTETKICVKLYLIARFKIKQIRFYYGGTGGKTFLTQI